MYVHIYVGFGGRPVLHTISCRTLNDYLGIQQTETQKDTATFLAFRSSYYSIVTNQQQVQLVLNRIHLLRVHINLLHNICIFTSIIELASKSTSGKPFRNELEARIILLSRKYFVLEYYTIV